MKHMEPGMEEEIDFRKKLKEAKESKINTKAAFPQAKPKGAQVDFRDVLRRAGGPEKKDFKSGSKAQLDFRDLLKVRMHVWWCSDIMLYCYRNQMLKTDQEATLLSQNRRGALQLSTGRRKKSKNWNQRNQPKRSRLKKNLSHQK